MGGWLMEVGKMAVYLAFPISLFYYFNRPELYEKYVINIRREVFPPDSKTHNKEMQEFIKEAQIKQQLDMLKVFEQEAEKP